MPTTIKATQENAPFLRELIADWPELAQTINGLRHQGVFPGLRCVTIILDDPAAIKDVTGPVHADSEQKRLRVFHSNQDGKFRKEAGTGGVLRTPSYPSRS